jgi:hypothetical protein
MFLQDRPFDDGCGQVLGWRDGRPVNTISPATGAHFARHAAHLTGRTASLNNLATVCRKQAVGQKTFF